MKEIKNCVKSVKGKCKISYCYQNCRKLSKELYKKDIDHDLYYVGLIEDLIQHYDITKEQCIKANKQNKYDDNIPETIEELPDSVNHYVIVVNDDTIVEACSEIRNRNCFGDIYIGEWPEDEYLKLKDSKLDIKSKFSHFIDY